MAELELHQINSATPLELLDKVHDTLLDIFLNGEPMLVALNRYSFDSRPGFSALVRAIIQRQMNGPNEGLSRFFYDPATQQVAAICLNDRFTDVYGMEDIIVPSIGPILDALDQMEHNYFHPIGREAKYSNDQVLRVFMVAVSNQYGRRGLANRLIQESLTIARDKGFRALASEATNCFSLMAFLRNGFVVDHELDCSNWVSKDGRKLFAELCHPQRVGELDPHSVHMVAYDLYP
eukprot:TRINITY_DN4829_c0_g1_i2.p1 TRINITY_DN4829_c0_g1~~TRINITY_DN4829_c0_g1_i2.p1  ORF type:complete len:259 (+),score=57.81 TRINITY_DN4829_c0_g1_i2:75-779(+)